MRLPARFRALRPDPLPPVTGRVVLWGSASSPAALSLQRRAGVELLVVPPDESRANAHARLAGWGPLDAVVDAAEGGDAAARRLRTAYLHLRDGGRYHLLQGGLTAEQATAVVVAAAGGSDQPGVEVTTRGLALTRTGRTLATLREAQMDLALDTDPSRGRVLCTVEGSSFRSRSEVRDPTGGGVPTAYDAPPVHLREYDDVVCRPKSVVVQRGLVPPDTFRHHLAKKLKHMELRPVADGFVRAPRQRGQQRLPGTYFHLDNEHRGFFGHALTEQVSRLWGLAEARRAHPDLRVLVSLNRGRTLAGWELTLMGAAGIRPGDLEVIDGPVRVDRLLSATPMFSMPRYVHPAIVETWDAVGAALRSGASDRPWPRRIFCSRRHEKRPCLNRLEVEQLFAGRGFEVVFPEDHPLPDQAQMFHRAEVVAGFAGSGLFTTMFAETPKHLVLIRPGHYRPVNELMIAAVRGHRVDVVPARTPDVLPPGVSPERVLRWPFVVDLDEQSAWLAEIFDSLDR